jgi:hypothetical protein
MRFRQRVAAADLLVIDKDINAVLLKISLQLFGYRLVLPGIADENFWGITFE